MRPIWKGLISFGLVSIPVALYPAEAPEGRIRFHQVDRRTLEPVRQKRVNERTGEEVPYEEIVRAFELEPGTFVTITDEEVRTALPNSTGTIDVLAFVPAGAIGVEYHSKPYFLAPDAAGRKPYALLREALLRANRVAIGRFVLRTRAYLVAISAEEGQLRATLLRFAHELREPTGLDIPSSDLSELNITDKELAMADQLIKALAEEWDPSSYRDDYYDNMVALVREKALTGEVHSLEATMPTPPATGEVIDLVALLRRSVEEATAQRPTDEPTARTRQA